MEEKVRYIAVDCIELGRIESAADGRWRWHALGGETGMASTVDEAEQAIEGALRSPMAKAAE